MPAQAVLICTSTRVLDELKPVVENAGYAVQGFVRRDGEPLRDLLTQVAPGALVVFDADGELEAEELDDVEQLTSRQPPAQVLLLSGQRDAESLMAAMRAGVREVLPSPPKPPELAGAIERLSQRKPGAAGHRPAGRTIAFMSCKGGSGATFIATNVAWMLASQSALETVLVDLDLQYGDATFFVTDQHAKSNFGEVARQVDRLDAKLMQASMVQAAPHLWVLPAPEDPAASLAVTPQQVERVLEVASQGRAFVVVDVERQVDAVAIKALDRAETVFLVLEDMLPHVRDAKRLVQVLRNLGYPDKKLRLVLNKAGRHHGLEVERIEQVVGLKVAFTLPDDPAGVGEAVNAGTAIAQMHPHGAVARALQEIADSLSGTRHGARGWLGRLVGEH